MILKREVVDQLLDELHTQMHERQGSTIEIDPEFWHSIEYYLMQLPGNPSFRFLDGTAGIRYRGYEVRFKDWALDVM